MKFYQKRGFALVVLVLAILGSCVYGISKKPADLPQVSYGNWLRDDADLLTDETEASLRQYDQSWDSDYRAIIAVATLDTLNGWTYEKAAAELGSQWGLGGNDMLLLLVKDSDYYVALGDNVLDAMTDTYQAGLQGAVETPYYQGDYDAAALAFFRQADVFYAQTLGRQQSGGSYSDYEDNGAWQGNDSGSVTAVVLLVVGMMFFSLGAELAMSPMGERVGACITNTRRVCIMLTLGFLLGFLITISEPDLQVLANQVQALPNMWLIVTLAGGV